MLIVAACVAATVIVIAGSPQKTAIKHTESSCPNCASCDKKMQLEQAKKNSSMRRFISYYDLKSFR